MLKKRSIWTGSYLVLLGPGPDVRPRLDLFLAVFSLMEFIFCNFKSALNLAMNVSALLLTSGLEQNIGIVGSFTSFLSLVAGGPLASLSSISGEMALGVLLLLPALSKSPCILNGGGGGGGGGGIGWYGDSPPMLVLYSSSFKLLNLSSSIGGS
uniref:Uncharacterized protein n=1 Tax=Cucumis sativus TaxID=3659 RepID=A0A0A0K7V2_CUCSA